MKRFLALFATLAIVVSMFSGIAFAADNCYEFTYDLDGDVYADTDIEVPVTLAAVGTPTAYDHVRIKVTYTGPGTLELWATDTSGQEYDVADLGYWGPAEGFAVDENYSETTPFTAWFSDPGSYTITIDLVDLDDSQAVIATEEIEVDVDYKYFVELDADFAPATDDVVYISGRIVDGNGFTVSDFFEIEITNGLETITDATANGIFDIPIDGTGLFGTFDVNATYVKNNAVEVKSSAFTFGYEVTLEEELEYPANNEDYVVIRGTLTDGSGESAAGVDVALHYVNADGTQGDLIESTVTSAAGSFAILLEPNEFTVKGDIGLYASNDGSTWVKVASGEVTPATVTINVNIDSAVARIHEYEISVTDADGDPINTGWAIYDEDDEVLDPVGGKYTFPEAGTYTVKYSTDTEYAEATIEVTEPQAVNLVNWPDTIDFTEVEIGFGTGTEGVDVDNRIDVVEADTSLADYFMVNAAGAGITEIEMDEKAAASECVFTLDPTTAGEIEFTIKAWRKIGDKFKYLGEFNKTITVEGYFVEYDVKELVVGEEADITFIVKDTDGNPVNNAKLTLGSYEVDGKTANIVGGTYVVKDVKSTVPASLDLTIVASDGTTVKASITGAVKVVGERVYDVIGDENTLLLGKNETIILTVTEDDEVVLPADIKVAAGTATIVSSVPYDSDEDGIKESVKLVVRAEGTKDVVLRVQNTSATKIGDYTLTVVKPTLVWEGEDVVTDGYKQWVSFKVIDPRDGSVLNKTINIVPQHVHNDDKDFILDEYDVAVTLSGEIEGYGLFAADWAAAEDAEEDPILEFTIKLDAADPVAVEGSVAIEAATLTVEPEDVIIGQRNDLTITLVDAEGEPLEGYTVYVDGEAIGKTDESGQVQYTIMQAMADKLEFAAVTDYSYDDEGDTVTRFVILEVRPTLDSKAPIVEVPTEVDTDTVVLVVKDNVRIVRLMINGEEQNIFPVPEVKVFLQLQEGVNLVHVQAMDNNYNVLDEIVEITYTPPAPVFEPVELTIGVDTGFGAPEKLVVGDAAVTMVPVRVAEQLLGATMDYVDGTVTYTLGETTITATLGSTTATVNGENITLPVAPYIKEVNGVGRMFVPLRLIAQELGFNVEFTSWDAPIVITQ